MKSSRERQRQSGGVVSQAGARLRSIEEGRGGGTKVAAGERKGSQSRRCETAPDDLPESEDLGAFLFSCGKNETKPWLLRVVWGVLALSLILVLFGGLQLRFIGMCVGGFLFVAHGILRLSYWALRFRYLAVYEHGLIRRKGRNRFIRSLYGDAETMSWSLVDISHNHVSVGQNYCLRIRQEDGTQLCFRGRFDARSQRMADVQDLYAEAIAHRLGRELVLRGRALWCGKLVLFRDGVGLYPSRRRAEAGGEPREFIPWSDLQFKVTGQRFRIRSRSRRRVRASCPTSAWMFGPGYLLLHALSDPAASGSAASAESRAEAQGHAVLDAPCAPSDLAHEIAVRAEGGGNDQDVLAPSAP